MTRNMVMSTGQGIFSFLFLIAATTGSVFQFVTVYQHVLTYVPGDALFITLYSLSISTLVTGGSAILWSLFRSSKFQMISAGFYIMAIALILPIYSAVTGGAFPYVIGAYSQLPWLFVLPTIPMLDFVGFWMATGAGLLTMISGFAIPKRQVV